MVDAKWYLLQNHNHASNDGAGCPVVFGDEPAAPRHAALIPLGPAQLPRLGVTVALLLAVCALSLLWLGQAHAATPGDVSLRKLGQQVCAEQGESCGTLWHARLDAGDAFGALVAAVCLEARAAGDELDGITCLEAAIQGAPALPPSVLRGGTIAGAALLQQGGATRVSDALWTRRVATHFAAIPGYCDQTTPMITQYFDCLLREVQTYEVALAQQS